MISDRQIEKFRTIYKARFGREISQEEALEKGIRLIQLLPVLIRANKKQEFDDSSA